MYHHSQWSPSSSRSSSLSSCGQGSDYSDDVFGLKGLVHAFYAPELESELERLFIGSEGSSTGGRSSPESLAESPRGTQKSVWDDFRTNGNDCQLDDLDRLFLGLPTGLPEVHQPYSASSDESNPPSPPPLSVIVDHLSGTEEASPANPSNVAPANQVVQEILTKAHLIDILREREQLQRAARNVKRVIVSGGGVTGGKQTNKSANGKVCVFCRNNGEPESVYSSHQLKDPEGNVTCPILYIYTCPICGANGKQSHTIKYCPYNNGSTPSMSNLTKTPRDRKSVV